MNFHPLTELFPLIEGDEFHDLAVDITENGLREPIVLFKGAVLDGRNRYRACADCGVKPTFVDYTGDDPLAFVLSKNLRRRHLDASQRAMVAAKLTTWKNGANQHTEGSANLQTIGKAARRLNVSPRSVASAKTVQEAGVPELQAAVDAGEISVAAAELVARMPIRDQRKIVAKGRDEILRAAATIRAWDSAKRREDTEQEGERQAEGRERRLRTAPPWVFEPHQGQRVVRTYEEMVDALVDRRRQLGWTQEVLDDRAGFQIGYAAKLENWRGPQGRVAGSVTMPLWFEALALGFIPIAFNATGSAISRPPMEPTDLARRIPNEA